MTITITTKTGIATINPTYEMGGGVDGYWLEGSTINGDRLDEIIHVPYYPDNPDKEWVTLSEYGRNQVREEGWRVCTPDETIAYVMKTLKFEEEDANRLRQENEKLLNESRTHFLEAAETLEYNSKWLDSQFRKIKTNNQLLKIWERLYVILDNRDKIWGNWEPPAEQS